MKARYRGSALGFLWSFVNPLLLLLIYTFVFTVVMPNAHPPEYQPYALFLFCGLLPWTWFSASLLESSSALVAGGYVLEAVTPVDQFVWSGHVELVAAFSRA